MVKAVHIQNFKSVVDLNLELGQFNVLIGENGCGKSNILEGITFAGAAVTNKLDDEFLISRGIRTTEPAFLMSRFLKGNKNIGLNIEFSHTAHPITLNIFYDKEWKDLGQNEHIDFYDTFLDGLISNDISKISLDEDDKQNLKKMSDNFAELIKKFDLNPELIQSYAKQTLQKEIKKSYTNKDLGSFLIYSPENTSLRKFQEEGQIKPLGIKGEGLFKQLKKIFLDNKLIKQQKDINETIQLIDWFNTFYIPTDLFSNEYTVNIQDKYLDKLDYFDQRSANEGFLFLLFYSVLFTSKNTPTFFAIDNIESSFNPKLCTEIIKHLAKLSKKYKKQVIVTTHNPAILDGLDLTKGDQRLFVVRRNSEGHTIANRVERKKGSTANLSEVWRKGFIGGLPENF